MDLATWIVVPITVGWVVTLLMHRDLDKVSWCDFAIAVSGAGAAGALLEHFGAPLSGPRGISVLGALGAGFGALALLAAANLARYRKLRPEPPPRRICWRHSLDGWQRSGTDG